MTLKLVGDEKCRPWKIQSTSNINYEVLTYAHIQSTNQEWLSNWQYIFDIYKHYVHTLKAIVHPLIESVV